MGRGLRCRARGAGQWRRPGAAPRQPRRDDSLAAPGTDRSGRGGQFSRGPGPAPLGCHRYDLDRCRHPHLRRIPPAGLGAALRRCGRVGRQALHAGRPDQGRLQRGQGRPGRLGGPAVALPLGVAWAPHPLSHPWQLFAVDTGSRHHRDRDRRAGPGPGDGNAVEARAVQRGVDQGGRLPRQVRRSRTRTPAHQRERAVARGHALGRPVPASAVREPAAGPGRAGGLAAPGRRNGRAQQHRPGHRAGHGPSSTRPPCSRRTRSRCSSGTSRAARRWSEATPTGPPGAATRARPRRRLRRRERDRARWSARTARPTSASCG